MGTRRVVTGHNAEGKAVFASDEQVEPVTLSLIPGMEFHLLWGADATLEFPDDGSKPDGPKYFPPVGGSRFAIFTIPPDDGRGVPEGLDVGAALEEFAQKLPGMMEHLEPDHPGMHTTATIDYGIVLSGEPIMELDDGATVTLSPGDTYVQNGTRHRWSNAGSVTAVIAVALIGAKNDAVG